VSMPKSMQHKKILVTYGPTWVALDAMRVISNRSSGSMGQTIIADLLKTGARVTALEGPVPLPLNPSPRLRVKRFQFFDELKSLLDTELKTPYDIIIHAAAVADFRPQRRIQGKISSDNPLNITLKPTAKLIRRFKQCQPQAFLAGFKLEASPSQRTLKNAAMRLITEDQCDVVIANSLANGYTGLLFDRDGSCLAQARSRQEMSRNLVQYLIGEMS